MKNKSEITYLVDLITNYFDKNKKEIYFEDRTNHIMRELKRIEGSEDPFKEDKIKSINKELIKLKNKDEEVLPQSHVMDGSQIYLSPIEVNVHENKDSFDITLEPKSNWLGKVAAQCDIKLHSIQMNIIALYKLLSEEDKAKCGVMLDIDARKKALRIKKSLFNSQFKQ